MAQNTNSAIIVAAGSGTRMGNTVPKQFLPLCGRAVLMHTIDKFASVSTIDEIIVVISNSERVRWQNLCNEYDFTTPHTIIDGGDSRSESVARGLNAVQRGGGVVLIHDGARPFVSKKLILKAIEAAVESRAAVPCVELSDSLRVVDDNGEINKAVDRTQFRAIQTPQSFDKELIFRAYNSNQGRNFLDDASLVESFGVTIKLFEGEKSNIKITTKEDMLLSRYLMENDICDK